MNRSLRQIHDRLLDQHNALSGQLGLATDPVKAKAILVEMQEILHRIDLIQGLLFRHTSHALEKSVPEIEYANQQLTDSISKIDDMAGFLRSAAVFLEAVDRAIDIAK